MAKCPNCGVTVAFHDAEKVKCYTCGKLLRAVVGKDAAGFKRTTAVLDSKPKPK